MSVESDLLPANMQNALPAEAGPGELPACIARPRRAPNQPLRPYERRERCRDLAAGEMTMREIARKHGVSHQAISRFARDHYDEIEAIRQRLDDEFAGLWIARKEARISAYQEEYETARDARQSSHHEWIKTRTQILHTVAEELGQLPPRTQVAVVPVQHILISASGEDLGQYLK